MLSSIPSATARASSSAKQPDRVRIELAAVDDVRAQRAMHGVVEVLGRQLREDRPQVRMCEHPGKRVSLELRARVEDAL